MRDAGTERPVFGPVRIDVYPLMIVRGICKSVDAVLLDRYPLGRSESFPDGGQQLPGMCKYSAHIFF